MRAQDMLPDHLDVAHIDGVAVRKGSVAAFLANARTLSNPHADDEARAQAEQHIRQALPALRAVGLFDVLEIRDPTLRGWIDSIG
ncbi:hypothetical protein [Lysobacter sp. CA199]|uniref:hypothetical protein n=1 Tax=Lysobacter sp. CA199 TaxID=3455608 RepID=UPI003F8D37AE